MDKVWTVEEIKNNIMTNDKWAIRGLLAIYNRQTEYEQSVEEAVTCNGIGFNGADSRFMSSIAKFFLEKNYISAKQMYYVRKRLVKYCRQLTKIANGKIWT